MIDEHRSTLVIPTDHPCLAGHFPGNPIVPGVVLLEQVALAAEVWLCEPLVIRQFDQVKFLSPLRPEEPLKIVLSGGRPQLRFRCESEGRLLAQGSFTI